MQRLELDKGNGTERILDMLGLASNRKVLSGDSVHGFGGKACFFCFFVCVCFPHGPRVRHNPEHAQHEQEDQQEPKAKKRNRQGARTQINGRGGNSLQFKSKKGTLKQQTRKNKLKFTLAPLTPTP